MASDKAFIFHLSISCGLNFSLVSRSSVKIKVKRQGHIKKEKIQLYGAFVLSQRPCITLFFTKPCDVFFPSYVKNVIKMFEVHFHD